MKGGGMTAAPEPHVSWIGTESVTGDRPRRRVRRALGGWARAALAWATRPARLLPGWGAVACGVGGAYRLWGLGVALIVAAAFLLLLDARIPRA